MNEQQREIERGIYLLADIIPDAMLVVTLEGEIQFANKKLEILTEYTMGELLNLTVHDLVEKQYREAHRENFKTISVDETPYYDLPKLRNLVTKTGIVIPVTVTAAKYRKNGTYNYISIIRDERPTLSDLVALQQVLDHVPAMVAIYDIDKKFRFANESFRNVFDISDENMISNNVFPDEETKSRGLIHMFGDDKKWESFTLIDKNGKPFTSSWYNMKISQFYIAFGVDTAEISDNEKLLREALAVVIERKKWISKSTN